MKVGLIGNPNVGKSTVFNALTGMHQHTGNWSGKTVDKASGFRKYNGINYYFEDLPGTYSLTTHSKEEEVTRDFVYFGEYDALIIICDATALERNLHLVMQVLEITNKVVIGVNLLDEAYKKKIKIDLNKLEDLLEVPVVPVIARKKKGIKELLDKLNDVCFKPRKVYKVEYPNIIKENLMKLYPFIPNSFNKDIVAIKLLTRDYSFLNAYDFKYKTDLARDLELKDKVRDILNDFYRKGITRDDIDTLTTEIISEKCEKIALETVIYENKDYDKKDRFWDKILTSKITGIPIMLVLLFVVFWITIKGSNYFSDFLYDIFFSFEDNLLDFFNFCHLPDIVISALVYGVYRTLSWVVSVMLPPMLIFFPLFTLLEDLGYLPRIAFTLDNVFKKCASCGKQALSMVMGFGCNVVGVMGARIIDSPRERLMAILTNVFVPCNGRFPLLISMITMFLVTGVTSGFASALILTFVILIGILVTFLVSKILSKTILKGVPSSFTLELPPYRKPQIIKTIIRSIFDRTLMVLKKTLIISAPAGLFIWLLANITIGGETLLQICASFLDPFGRVIGLDGVIVLSFILGFPANEIVIPIMIMSYMSLGYMTDFDNLSLLKDLFLENGWTVMTAISVMLFSLMHFPCGATVWTIKKETGKWKWAILSIIIPLVTGVVILFLINFIYRIVCSFI